MNIVDKRTASDLVSEFPRRLIPQPQLVRLALCTKGDSNYTSFRKCLGVVLNSNDASQPRTGKSVTNREPNNDWLDSLGSHLSQSSADLHRARLSLVKEVYKLAYGGILEDLEAYGVLKGNSLGRRDDELLRDCIGETLLRHAGLAELSPRDVYLTDLDPELVRRLLHECFDLSNDNEIQRQHFMLLRSGCLMGNGERMHIPMLDFRISVGDNSLDIVSAATKALLASMPTLEDCEGAILNSGQSYHFCGFTLMSDSELNDFLYRALLLIPIVDARYIGHSLRDQELCLRISGRSLHDHGPIVERWIT
jgi:hypothetical protein